MIEITAELLKEISVFGGLKPETLEFLLEQAEVVEVPRKQFFFREGEHGNAFFILRAGKVAVIKAWEGRQYLLGELVGGDCFGEMALIEMHPRNASVVAVDECRAIKLGFGSLFQLYNRDLEQFAILQMNLGREVSRRLREANDNIFECRIHLASSRNVPGYPEISLDEDPPEPDIRQGPPC